MISWVALHRFALIDELSSSTSSSASEAMPEASAPCTPALCSFPTIHTFSNGMSRHGGAAIKVGTLRSGSRNTGSTKNDASALVHDVRASVQTAPERLTTPERPACALTRLRSGSGGGVPKSICTPNAGWKGTPAGCPEATPTSMSISTSSQFCFARVVDGQSAHA